MAYIHRESREIYMRKEEYLALLEKELQQYPSTFKQDLLDSFEQHFQEGLEEGKSEEEIMDNLGSINEVMDNIRMLNGEPNTFTSKEDSINQLKESITQLTNDLKDTFHSLTSTMNCLLKITLRN